MTTTPPDDAQNISWSLGETASLAIKAARGAGLSWGHAEETGFAVSWLHARGISGLSALCRYLNWRSSGTLIHWPDRIVGNSYYCPIELGTAYLDGALTATITIERIREPALFLPFIAIRSGNLPARVTLGHLCLHVSANGVLGHKWDTALLLSKAQCKITTVTNAPILPETTNSHRVPSCFYRCVETLQAFASKTYAPATEESRLAGAGPSLNDND